MVIAGVLACAAVAVLALGAVRTARRIGPASGIRLVFAIEAPVDAAALRMARHVAYERVSEKSADVAVKIDGDQIVAELGESDPEFVDGIAALLMRTARLELHLVDTESDWIARVAAYATTDPETRHAGIRVEGALLIGPSSGLAEYLDKLAARDPAFAPPASRALAYGHVHADSPEWRVYLLDRGVVIDGRSIVSVRYAFDTTGTTAVAVALDPRGAKAVAELSRAVAGKPFAFTLDGTVHFVGPVPPATTGPTMTIDLPGTDEKEQFRAAFDLSAVLEAGAVHPLQLVRKEPFTDEPARWWPYLLAAFVLAALAVFAWRRTRVTGRRETPRSA
jgi:preprotein translocase subunit SecD